MLNLLIPFLLTSFTFFLTYFFISFILFVVQEEKSEPRTTLFTSSGTTTADSLKGRSAIPLTKKVTKGIWLNFIKSWFIYLILSYFIQVCSKLCYFYFYFFNLLRFNLLFYILMLWLLMSIFIFSLHFLIYCLQTRVCPLYYITILFNYWYTTSYSFTIFFIYEDLFTSITLSLLILLFLSLLLLLL